MKPRILSLVSLFFGIGLLIYFLHQSGTAEIVARVRILGTGFILILGISAVRQAARAIAWQRCFASHQPVGFWSILRARLAGDAMADLTAAGPVIGEPLKILKLSAGRAVTDVTVALAIENLMYAVSSGFMILFGTIALLAYFSVGHSLRTTGIIVICGVLLLLLVVALVMSRRWKLLSWFLLTVAKIIGLKNQKIYRIRDVEHAVFEFAHQRVLSFLIVALCELLFHCAGVLEIFATLRLSGSRVTLLQAFILEAINRVINIVFAFVPALVGVDEAGSGLLSQAIGLGEPAGIALALIRKGRMLFWIACGVVFLWEPGRRVGKSHQPNIE